MINNMENIENDNEDFCSTKEYIWGCQLTAENASFTWQLDEDEDEKDFLTHTLFLKHAVLGLNSVKDERNLVEMTTKNANGEQLKMPMLSLTLGQNDSTFLDLCFTQMCPATFTLVQGTGPVCIIGQESTEYPEEVGDVSQDEDDFEEEAEIEEEVAAAKPVAVAKKRKAPPVANGKSKKGKLDNTAEDSDEDMASDDNEEDVDEEDDGDGDEDEDFNEESEEESSPELKKKGKGAKKPQAKPKPAAKVPIKNAKEVKSKASPAAVPAKKIPVKKVKK